MKLWFDPIEAECLREGILGKKESDALVPAPLAISDNKQDIAFMSMMPNVGFFPTSNIKERTLTVFQNSFWQIYKR